MSPLNTAFGSSSYSHLQIYIIKTQMLTNKYIMNHGPIIANKLSLRLMMGPSINLIDSPFTLGLRYMMDG